MTQPTTLTAAAARIHAGTLQPVELVEQCLDRIRKYDDRVKAVVEHEGTAVPTSVVVSPDSEGSDRCGEIEVSLRHGVRIVDDDSSNI